MLWMQRKPQPRTKRMSLYQWHQELGQPVPLEMLPRLMKMDAAAVARTLRASSIRVHAFRTAQGKTLRAIRFDDYRKLRRQCAEAQRMREAMRMVFARWAGS